MEMSQLTASDMNQHLEAYEAYLRRVRMSSTRTVERYMAVLLGFERFMAASAVNPPLEQVQKDDLQHFLQQRGATGAAPSRSTWNTRLAALRSFYAFLYKRELVQANPALKVDRLRLTSTERLPLTFDEMLQLVDAVREHSPTKLSTRPADPVVASGIASSECHLARR